MKYPPRRLEITLSKEHETTVVGDVLRRELHISTAVIRRIKFLPHGILLDGERVRTNVYGKAGQKLSALVGESQRRSQILPVAGELNIVYEDQDFILLHKASNVVVHPTHCHLEDTLGNFLLHYYDTQGFTGDFHPVHRLDRGTSGLLVVAKHPFAQEQFTKQIHTPSFSREYLALVWGRPVPEQGEISAPIHQLEKMKRCVHPEGLHATTEYQVLSSGQLEGKELTLLSARLKTGRTHQIRVHFSHLNHPLIGDELYGFGDYLSHTALHAFRLKLCHPVTGEALCFTAKPPEDFCQLLEKASIPFPEALFSEGKT